MSTTRRPDASKSDPLHIEQQTISNESSYFEESIEDEHADKRLLRKLDMRIVPNLWLMFMLAFLDRTNVCCTTET